jgi:hypothetical protein
MSSAFQCCLVKATVHNVLQSKMTVKEDMGFFFYFVSSNFILLGIEDFDIFM